MKLKNVILMASFVLAGNVFAADGVGNSSILKNELAGISASIQKC